MKKKLVHISEVLYSPHYHVINVFPALMPIFVPISLAKKDLQHHFTDDLRETNGTSTAWWRGDPQGCSQRPQRGADSCTTSITPQRGAQAGKLGFGLLSWKHTHGTSDLPLAHLQSLLASALCSSAHPAMAWQCRSIPAACRDSLASTLGSPGVPPHIPAKISNFPSLWNLIPPDISTGFTCSSKDSDKLYKPQLKS